MPMTPQSNPCQTVGQTCSKLGLETLYCQRYQLALIYQLSYVCYKVAGGTSNHATAQAWQPGGVKGCTCWHIQC